jgi:release factor glutamine methyltransferase
VTNPFTPSEYTAALLFHIRRRSPEINLDSVLEIGTGSGVLLAALLGLGAKRALGVDIEPTAVESTKELLRQEGSDGRAQVVLGDMWQPCEGQRFDLVVCNLPQFAAQHVAADGRLPSWSAAGLDGRGQVDRFLAGLPDHLGPQGLAIMTHNEFIDADKTRLLLEPRLQARVAYSASAPMSPQKMSNLRPEVLERSAGRGVHQVGPYWFVDFDILEISWKPDAPPGR